MRDLAENSGQGNSYHNSWRYSGRSRKLCPGQIAGADAAVHATIEAFASDNTEAVLLVNASNALNSLNRQVALQNIRRLFPSIAMPLINGNLQTSLWMAPPSSPKRAPHKATHWQCQCMPWLHFHSSTSSQVFSKSIYLALTTPNIATLLLPLGDVLRGNSSQQY